MSKIKIWFTFNDVPMAGIFNDMYHWKRFRKFQEKFEKNKILYERRAALSNQEVRKLEEIL